MTQNRAIIIAVSAFLLIASTPAVFASGGEGGDEKSVAGPLYIDFKNIAVPVIKKNGRSGLLAISMTAEVTDEKSHSYVMNNMPRLRDAFIRTLYGNIENNRFVKADGTLDIDNIKANLMKSARYVMRKQEGISIQDLLFQNIAQQTY